MCSVCLYPGGRRRGLGGRRGLAGGASPERHSRGGVSELGCSRRGIPASDFLSLLPLGSCPAAPSPPPKGRQASPQRMQIVGKFTSVSF